VSETLRGVSYPEVREKAKRAGRTISSWAANVNEVFLRAVELLLAKARTFR